MNRLIPSVAIATVLASSVPILSPFLSPGLVEAAQTWQRFSSAGGAFTVMMPSKPKEVKQTRSTAAGPITIYVYGADQGKVGYFASYADFPVDLSSVDSEQLFNLMASAININLSEQKGKFLSQQQLNLNGMMGREMVLEAPGKKAILRVRIYVGGRRMYQVGMVYPPNQAKALDSNIGRFMNSFQVGGAAATPTTVSPTAGTPAAPTAGSQPIAAPPTSSAPGADDPSCRGKRVVKVNGGYVCM